MGSESKAQDDCHPLSPRWSWGPHPGMSHTALTLGSMGQMRAGQRAERKPETRSRALELEATSDPVLLTLILLFSETGLG